MLRSAAVALRDVHRQLEGASGIRYSVDMTAESVYCFGVSALRKRGWADVALGTELEIHVQRTAHVPPHHSAPDSSVV
jgi:hypothetical protein